MEVVKFGMAMYPPYSSLCTVEAYGRSLNLTSFSAHHPACRKPGLAIRIIQLVEKMSYDIHSRFPERLKDYSSRQCFQTLDY